jgi:hypothetical protein
VLVCYQTKSIPCYFIVYFNISTHITAQLTSIFFNTFFQPSSLSCESTCELPETVEVLCTQ